jgi:hypothetical protein
MNNRHLALIFIRCFSDSFREPLDQLSIVIRRQRGQLDSGRAPGATSEAAAACPQGAHGND